MFINGKLYTTAKQKKELKRQKFLKCIHKRHDVLMSDEIRTLVVLEDIMHMNVASVVPGFAMGKYELLHCLGEVYKDSRGEGMAFTDLAALSNMPLPHLSRGLKKMEEEKLIRRKQDPDDKRSTRIFFTPKGKEMYDKTEKVMHDFYVDVFENISREKLQSLAPLMEQLDRSLKREIKRRVSGSLKENIAEFMDSEIPEEDRDLTRSKAQDRR